MTTQDHQRSNPYILKRALFVGIALVTSALLVGFKPAQITSFEEHLKKEIEKIREYSPRVKIRRQWLSEFKQAKGERKKAIFEGAETFAKDLLEQGNRLLDLSLTYAKKNEFNKAEYLARKAIDVFKKCVAAAKENREKELAKREDMLRLFKKRLDSMPKSTISHKRDQIVLRLITLKNALRAEDLTAFDETAKEVEALLGK